MGSSATARVQTEPGLPPEHALLTETEAALSALDPISLSDIGDAALLDRFDRKYLLPAPLAPTLVAGVAGGYRVLEIEGRRLGHYVTQYFDTPDFALYHAHHSGRIPRYKVRIRSYTDTGERFLEVKLRRRGGRTLKSRVPLTTDGEDPLLRLEKEDLLGIGAAVPIRTLRPTVRIQYRRATLVAKGAIERVAVDLALEASYGGVRRPFPGVAIVEVKQVERTETPVVQVLRALRVRRRGLSKYCLSLATLEPELKRNRFKRSLEALDALGRGPHPLP